MLTKNSVRDAGYGANTPWSVIYYDFPKYIDQFQLLGGLYYSDYDGDTGSAVEIPNLLGMTYDEAAAKLNSLGLRCYKGGKGTVITDVSFEGTNITDLLGTGVKITKGSQLFVFCK